MSRKIGGFDNYRVVINPRRLGDYGSISMSDNFFTSGEEDRQKQYKERCEEIAKDVERHVDNVGSALVEFDTFYVCEHCGADWTEKTEDYNGGCCDKDEQ